jgi:hypothetical protein
LKLTGIQSRSSRAIVAIVSCEFGSVLGVGAYYPSERIDVSGKSKVFTHRSDAGKKWETRFCADCETSLYWNSKFCLITSGSPSVPSLIRSFLHR